MLVSKFIDDINALLRMKNIYYETENEFCFDCRVKNELGFDKKMLDELKFLGILKANKNRFTKVLKFKRKNYRWMVIDKQKFKSLERLILLGDEGYGKISKRNI